jgi:structural maintenance of chromosome 4
MDEIDAALDFKNVSIVANYIKVCQRCFLVAHINITVFASPQERTKNAQFIIISLRNNMFELADRLVGIYKTQDVTKSVTINPKAIAAECAAAMAAGAVSEAEGTSASGKGASKSLAMGEAALGERTNV